MPLDNMRWNPDHDIYNYFVNCKHRKIATSADFIAAATRGRGGGGNTVNSV